MLSLLALALPGLLLLVGLFFLFGEGEQAVRARPMHPLAARQGGWIGLATGAIGAIGGLFGGHHASHKAGQANKKAEEVIGRQRDLANQQSARADALYNQYQTLYAPAKQQALTQARAGVFDPNAEAGRAVAGIASASDQAQGVRRRELRRLGVNPNSGRFAGLSDTFAINRAAAEAGAANTARRSARLRNFTTLNSVSNQGDRLINQAGYFENSANRGLGDVLNYYGDQNAAYAKQAAGYGAETGAGLSDIGHAKKANNALDNVLGGLF